MALLFFGLGIFVSAFALGNEKFFLTELTESQQHFLKEMAEMVFSGSPVRGIILLFINNLLASLQMMLLGVLLGIPPLFGLFTNGALLGSLLIGLGHEGVSALTFMWVGVLPHGIFELPAFLISAAFGLKMGFHLVFPLPQKKRGESLSFIWREFLAVFPLLINLLIIAAVIEVILTPLLVKLLF